MPGFLVFHHPLEFAETLVHRVGDAIQPPHPLLSPSPAFNLPQHQGFFFPNESALPSVGQSNETSASSSILTMNNPGCISFRIDWFDLLAVQSLLQHHSSKASVLWHSAFFLVQFSHPYMTTRKTIALTMQTVVSKVIFLLFNVLSRFIMAFLPRRKCLLISWLQAPSAVIFKSPKIKSVTVSIVSPSICHKVMDWMS